MRTLLLLKISLLVVISATFAQAPDTLWTKWYGGSEYDGTKNICLTSDGGFISCSHSNSFSKIYQTWLIRMNSKGDTLWTRILGDSVRPEEFISMEETSDGGFIACGGYFGLDAKYHTYLMKLNSEGDILWKNIIGITNNSSQGIQALQTIDNGFIVLARQSGTGAGFWLYKTDGLGNVIDSAKYYWNHYDIAEDIALSNDGGYVIAGISNSFGTSTDWEDMFLFKVNNGLDPLWLKLYANQDSLGSRLSSVMKTGDGGFLMVGAQEEFPNAQNRHDFLVVKTDEFGNEEWKRLYGSPRHEVGFNSIELSNGDFILTGNGSSKNGPGGFDALVMRINNQGDTVWTKYFGSPGFDELTQIKPVPAGGYILAGNTYYYSSDPNKTDVYFIRIDNDETGIYDNPAAKLNVAVSPNPFSESTTIHYELESAERVKTDIFNSLGEKITTLVDEWQEAGKHNAELRIENYELCSGMYYYRIQIGNRFESGKLIFVR